MFGTIRGGLRALFRRDAVERELADEVQHYLDLATRGTHSCRHVPGRGRTRRAAGDGRRRGDQGARAFGRMGDARGDPLARRAVRPARRAPEPWLRGDRHADAGARHGRQHGDVQRRQCRDAPSTAVSRRASSRLHVDRRHPSRAAPRTNRVPHDYRLGSQEPHVRRRGVLHDPARRADDEQPGRARSRAQRAGLRQPLRSAWRAARAGTRDLERRRIGPRAGRRHQPRVLAAPVRRRAGCRWQGPHDRRCVQGRPRDRHGHRRDACRFLLPRQTDRLVDAGDDLLAVHARERRAVSAVGAALDGDRTPRAGRLGRCGARGHRSHRPRVDGNIYEQRSGLSRLRRHRDANARRRRGNRPAIGVVAPAGRDRARPARRVRQRRQPAARPGRDAAARVRRAPGARRRTRHGSCVN